MASMAVLPGVTPAHRHHPSRSALLAVAVAAVGVASILLVVRIGDDSHTASTVAPAAAIAPVDAIERWLVANRAEAFPGADGPFLGTCPASTSGPTVGLCSALREDLGDVQLHSVGVYATDWGADLLVERRGERSWAVTGVSPWPELGSRYDGSPWSPVTAITAWWHERATAQYGAGAVHLRSCTDASVVGDTTQPLLCSVLLDARDGIRTYSSGLAGAPPDVELTVVERPDRTWLVTTTQRVGEGA
jgi:hypothetical protein